MTQLVGKLIKEIRDIPPSRDRAGNKGLILGFLESDAPGMLVRPTLVYKDAKKRKRQVASSYNTLKYHIKKLEVQDRVTVSVNNGDVYLKRTLH